MLVPFARIELTYPDYKTGPLPLRIKGHNKQDAVLLFFHKSFLFAGSILKLVSHVGFEPTLFLVPNQVPLARLGECELN
jgi:hypothetical protein